VSLCMASSSCQYEMITTILQQGYNDSKEKKEAVLIQNQRFSLLFSQIFADKKYSCLMDSYVQNAFSLVNFCFLEYCSIHIGGS